MRRIWDDLSSSFSGAAADAAVCLGNFDGVHLGHQALLFENDHLAKQQGLLRRVVTFEPHPRLLMGDPSFRYIYPDELKTLRIQRTGAVDELIAMRFDEILRQMGPEAFFEEILLGRYRAKAITVGDDFRFGRYGEGSPETLARLCDSCGIHLEILPRITLKGSAVSSSRIREYLEDGDIETASELLGSPYQIRGTVHQGKHVGRKLHAPTVNVWFEEHQVVPKRGVYASQIRIGDRLFHGISNVGINPTFGGERPRTETYIFDFDEDVYGEEIEVGLLHFMRPERTFESPEALREQIDRDIDHVKEFFKESTKR